MKRPIALTTLSILIAVAAAQATAGEAPKLVDCTLPIPQSIQDTLTGVDPDPGEALTITVRGLCTEDVLMLSDDITLRGEAPDGSDGISGGGITVRGARRVVIDSLTVTGSPGNGIQAEDGASMTVSNSYITDSGAQGIWVTRGSNAQIDGNTVTGSGLWGIIVTDSSTALLKSNTITQTNPRAAVEASRHGSIRLIGGNTITNTNGAANATAVESFNASNIRQDNIGDRGPDILTANRAVNVGNLSTLDMRQGFVATGSASVRMKGTLRMRNGTFNGQITVNSLSHVNLASAHVVNGDTFIDGLSSLEMSFGTYTGNITVDPQTASYARKFPSTFTGTCTGNCIGF